MKIDEITMIPARDFPARATEFYRNPKVTGKELPGFPGFTYVIEGDINPYSREPNGNLRLEIFDGEQQIAESKVSPNSYNFPLKCFQVSTIKVAPNYRGKGIASTIYQLWLNMRPIISDDYQTPGGRKMWAALYNHPNVEIKGHFLLPDRGGDDLIDNIMERGGQYIGLTKGNAHCFLFDVVPGKTNLQALVNPTKNPLYSRSDLADTSGLVAWYRGTVPELDEWG